MVVFLGKTGTSHEEKERSTTKQPHYVMNKAPKHVGNIVGQCIARCMQILTVPACEEYAHSVGTSVTCHHCHGNRSVGVWRDVVTCPGYIGRDGKEDIPPITAWQ